MKSAAKNSGFRKLKGELAKFQRDSHDLPGITVQDDTKLRRSVQARAQLQSGQEHDRGARGNGTRLRNC